jgi:DNA polymerase-3 subunit beta
MRITGKKETIYEAFRTVAKVLTTAVGKAVPQVIKLEALEDGTLRLFATDLERSIRCVKKSSDIKVEEPGVIALPGHKTLSILNTINDETVALQTTDDGNLLEILCKGGQFKVNLSPLDDLPPIPEPTWEDPITMDGAAFRTLIERTAFATAHEKIHYSLHGVFMRLWKKNIRMVGTDGRRLAIADGKVERSGSDPVEMIVPTKGIRIFEELLPDDRSVTLSHERNQLFLRADDVEAGTLLIDGKYPEFDNVVPKENHFKLTVDTEAFFAGLRQASVFVDTESKGVWLKIEPGKLVLFSNAAGAGEAEVEVEAEYDGEPMEIQFNPEFLRSARKLIEEKRMTIQMKDHKTAVILCARDSITYVVMPIVKK